MTTNSLSQYLAPVAEIIYGSQQEDYFLRAEEAICWTTKTIEAERESSLLFLKIFDELTKIRHDIAIRHASRYAHFFGSKRFSQIVPVVAPYLPSTTPLGAQYQEYNDILLNQLEILMTPSLNNEATSLKINQWKHEEVIFKQKCFFEVELFDIQEQIPRLEWDRPIDAKEVFKIVEHQKANIQEVVEDYTLMQKIKNTNESFYTRLLMLTAIHHIELQYPKPQYIILPNRQYTLEGDPQNLRNFYLLGTLKLEIDRKIITLSHTLTWMYQDDRTHPIERMRAHSVAYIIHQDPFLIEDTLKTIGKIFNQAVNWQQSEGLQELKNRVALLRFVYAHCMPCFRGDGAIGDWLELAIYRSHGFVHVKHNSETLPCFEPLASISLSHYLNRYDRTIRLEPSSLESPAA